MFMVSRVTWTNNGRPILKQYEDAGFSLNKENYRIFFLFTWNTFQQEITLKL